MNPYDGLNLPQLLELMHGLVLPPAVSWSPATPGWWIALAWVLAMLLIGAWQLIQHRRRNRYRREAKAALKAIESGAGQDPVAAASEIAELLKRTALAAYPRRQVASLCGAEWAEFLRVSASNDPIVTAASEQLAAAAYRADADGSVLVEPARRWIDVHRD